MNIKELEDTKQLYELINIIKEKVENNKLSMMKKITVTNEYCLDKNSFINEMHNFSSVEILIKVSCNLLTEGFCMDLKEVLDYWLAYSDSVCASFLIFNYNTLSDMEKISYDAEGIVDMIQQSNYKINECINTNLKVLRLSKYLDKWYELDEETLETCEKEYMKILENIFNRKRNI